MTYRAKLYRGDQDVLLAASDPELVGRRFTFNDVTVAVDPSFYGGVDDEVTESELVQMLHECSVANLMGTRTIAVAVKLGMVRGGNIMDVGGVYHAQIARMR